MKVIKSDKSKKDEKISITIRLKPKTIENLDKIGQLNNVSRQKLIEAIIEQAVVDQNFTLTI